MKKLGELCADEGFTTLRFLYNNAFEVETFIVAGSRGWYIDESNRRMPENADYQKIVAREAIRLEISLNEAVKLREKRLSETGEKRGRDPSSCTFRRIFANMSARKSQRY